MNTRHYNIDRQQRCAFIRDTIGVGNVIDSFVIDNGHVGGEEIHSVTDTGVIVIRNKKTDLLITEIIARPEQLRKLYETQSREPPKWLLKLAYKNNRKRFNEK